MTVSSRSGLAMPSSMASMFDSPSGSFRRAYAADSLSAILGAMGRQESSAAASTGDGLHVWVRTSARDPSLLLVRLLPDGQAPPPGAHEAYLRAADLGVDLLAQKL